MLRENDLVSGGVLGAKKPVAPIIEGIAELAAAADAFEGEGDGIEPKIFFGY